MQKYALSSCTVHEACRLFDGTSTIQLHSELLNAILLLTYTVAFSPKPLTIRGC